MRALISLLAVSCVLAAAGCGSRGSAAPKTPNMNERRYKSLVSMAEADTKCTTLKYEYLQNDVHRMSGCNTHADYILRCPGGPMCSWVAAPFKQASFDMKCPEEQLTSTKLSDTSFGIEGCGPRATYVMEDRRWSAAPQDSAATPTAAAAPTDPAAPAPSTAPAAPAAGAQGSEL
jgi:hypothetical protein